MSFFISLLSDSLQLLSVTQKFHPGHRGRVATCLRADAGKFRRFHSSSSMAPQITQLQKPQIVKQIDIP